MSLEIGSIVGRLVLQDEFTDKLDDAAQTARKQMGQLQLALGATSGAVLAMGAAMLGLAARTAQMRTEMANSARSVGMSVESYTKLAHAAKMADVDQNTFNRSLRALIEPSKQARETLSRLGVQVTDANGRLMPAEKTLMTLADRFKSIENPAERARAATQIFGERAAEMTNLLKDGSVEIARLGEEAKKLGLVFDEEAAEQADRFGDSIDAAKAAVDGLSQSIGQTIIEYVNQTKVIDSLTETISDVTAAWNELDDETKQSIMNAAAISVAIAGVVAALVALSAILPVVSSAFTAAFVTNPVGLILAGIAVTIGLVVLKWKELSTWLKPVTESFKDLKKTFQPLSEAMEKLGSAGSGGGFMERIKKIDFIATGLKIAFLNAAIGAVAFTTVIKQVGIIIDGIVSGFGGLMKMLDAVMSFGEEFEKYKKMGYGIADAFDLAWNYGNKKMQINADNFKEGMNQATGSVTKTIKASGEAWADGIQKMGYLARDVLTRQVPEVAREGGEKAGEEIAQGVKDTLKPELDKLKLQVNVKLKTDLESFGSGGFAGMIGERISQGLAGKTLSDILANTDIFKKSDDGKLEKLGEDQAKKIKDGFQKAFDEDGMPGLDKAVKESGIEGGDALMSAMSGAITGGASMIADALGKIIDAAYSTWVTIMQNKVVNITRKKEILDFAEKVITNWQKQQNERELEMLEDQEDAKIQIMRDAQSERLALINDEFAARKKQLEDELAARIAMERIAFEERKAVLDEKSADEEQRRLADAVMENDWNEYVKLLNEETQQAIADAAGESKNKQTEYKNQSNAEIEKAETNKAAMLEQKRKEQQKAEKDQAKAVIAIQYAMSLAAFEINKRMQLAAITVQLAQTIMSAMQAWAMMTATMGIIGFAIGGVMAAALTALAYTAYSTSRAQISSAVLLPPPELFAAEGGTIVGPSHAMGGVAVRAEGGETVLSRDLTNRIDASLDRPPVVVYVQPGAIQLHGIQNVDDRVVENIAERVGRKIEQRRF